MRIMAERDALDPCRTRANIHYTATCRTQQVERRRWPSTSPGYSITVRVEAPPPSARPRDLAAAVSRAGGALTALDVVESTPDRHRRRRHLRRRRRRPRRPGHRRRIEQLPGVDVRKVSDRTFLLHLGGKIEVTPEGRRCAPRRPVPRLHPRRGPGLPGDRREPGRRPPADHQAQHRRRGHRRLGRARPGQHRPGRGAAGDGGQGRAVQAVRRGRRLAGRAWTPRTPTRSSRSSRRSPRSTAASTWRTSPRRAASRSRRRLRELLDIPVFHDDQHGTAIVRAGRADQRAAGGRQGARRTSGSWSPAPARPGTRSSSCCCARASATSSAATGTAPCTAACPSLDRVPRRGSPSTPTRDGVQRHPGRGARRRRRVHRGLARRTC